MIIATNPDGYWLKIFFGFIFFLRHVVSPFHKTNIPQWLHIATNILNNF